MHASLLIRCNDIDMFGLAHTIGCAAAWRAAAQPMVCAGPPLLPAIDSHGARPSSQRLGC